MTIQPEAGTLSLQRRLNVNHGTKPQPWFDDVHGYGWRLLSLGDHSVESQLSDRSREFLVRQLGGRCVNVTAEQDSDGEYRDWFDTQMGTDHALLVRPDFYVFGHAASGEVNGMIEELRSKMGAA